MDFHMTEKHEGNTCIVQSSNEKMQKMPYKLWAVLVTCRLLRFVMPLNFHGQRSTISFVPAFVLLTWSWRVRSRFLSCGRHWTDSHTGVSACQSAQISWKSCIHASSSLPIIELFMTYKWSHVFGWTKWRQSNVQRHFDLLQLDLMTPAVREMIHLKLDDRMYLWGHARLQWQFFWVVFLRTLRANSSGFDKPCQLPQWIIWIIQDSTYTVQLLTAKLKRGRH